MLDTIGKVFEKLIGTVSMVIALTEQAWRGNNRSRKACVVVTLDVQNVFNSVSAGATIQGTATPSESRQQLPRQQGARI